VCWCGFTPVRQLAENIQMQGGVRMALLEWTDDLNVNVAEIDKQHQKLFAIINELHDAMRDRKTQEVLGKIINDLADYTKVHFYTEEKYFYQFNYPATASHIKEHEIFVEKVFDFVKGFEEKRLFLSTEITDFLKDWLVKHIKGTDQKYSSFFQEKGLT
jgi:hemerythrin